MVSGPEVATVIEDLEHANKLMERRDGVLHHDQIAFRKHLSVQKALKQVVCSLINVFEELGNPFEEESKDLLVLNSKEMLIQWQWRLKHANKIVQKKFKTFTKESIVDRTKPLDDTIPHNRSTLFNGSTKKLESKQKQQLILGKLL